MSWKNKKKEGFKSWWGRKDYYWDDEGYDRSFTGKPLWKSEDEFYDDYYGTYSSYYSGKGKKKSYWEYGTMASDLDYSDMSLREITRYSKDILKFLVSMWAEGKVKHLNIGTTDGVSINRSSLCTDSMELQSVSDVRQGFDVAADNDYDLGAVWRIIRFIAWHESMHFIHTPQNYASRLANDRILADVYNLVEDYRIEKLGVQEYIGMESERKFYATLVNLGFGDALGNHPFREFLYPKQMLWCLGLATKLMTGSCGAFSLEKDGGMIKDEEELKNRPVMTDAERARDSVIVRKMFLDKLGGIENFDLALKKEDYAKMDEFIELIKKKDAEMKSSATMSFMVSQAISDWVRARFKVNYNTCSSPSMSSKENLPPNRRSMYKDAWGDDEQRKAVNDRPGDPLSEAIAEHTSLPDHNYNMSKASDDATIQTVKDKMAMMTARLSKELQKRKDGSDFMKELMEDMPTQIAEEIQELKKVTEKAKTLSIVPYSWIPNINNTFEETMDRRMMIDIVSALRRWKDQMLETVDVVGSDIDVERLLLTEIKNEPIDNFYLTTEKIAPKDKIAVLMDTSGSMSGMMGDYQTALCTLIAALEHMHLKYSLTLFNDGFKTTDREVCLDLKTFKQKIMEPANKSTVANMIAQGGTPMGTALFEMAKRPEWREMKYLIILTDGGGTDGDVWYKALKMLRDSHVDYMFVGLSRDGSPLGEFVDLVKNGQLPESRYTTVALKELPKAFVNMVLGGKYV